MKRLKLLRAGLLGLGLLFVSATAALADWHQVTTDNFIVYGEGSARSVVREAEQLERFDRLMRQSFNLPPDPDARKLPVYLVRNRGELSQIESGIDRRISGFYRASPFGISASLIRGETSHVLFHEYAHHFMLQNFPGDYPGWFIEGFAEYFATADVKNVNRVSFGYFSPGRIHQLNQRRWLSIEKLLASKPSELSSEENPAFYAQSWLLTHYMLSDPNRLKAFGRYLDAVKSGTDWQTALQSEVGMSPEDLRQALRDYLSGSMKYGQITLANNHIPSEVKTLTPGADRFILTQAALQSSLPAARARSLLAELKPLEARYPNDPWALSVLGKLEQVWGDNAEAERLLTHLLSVDPNHTDGLITFAELKMEEARALTEASAINAKLREAQSYLTRVLDIDPTDFRTYRLLALIRQSSASYPTENDVETLITGLSYAPQVTGLRMQTADALRRRGMEAEAEVLLRVLRNQAHGAGQAPVSSEAQDEDGAPKDEDEDGAEADPAPTSDTDGPQPLK